MGSRACPPEDVGGVSGYAAFLDVIENPIHEERLEKIEWVGGEFDPDSSDLRAVNLRLYELTETIAQLGVLAGLEPR